MVVGGGLKESGTDGTRETSGVDLDRERWREVD
jgi:hypothetical protein